MKTIKKLLRIAVFMLLLVLALSGVGIMANFNRERYMDKGVTTEQMEKKEQENETGSSEMKNS